MCCHILICQVSIWLFESIVLFPSVCQSLQKGDGFSCACGWCQGSWSCHWHQTSCTDMLTQLFVCAHCYCPHPAFISHCTITVYSNKLTLIVQSGLLNQKRKKEKKLLIQCSLLRLKVCWNNGINNRTAVPSTLWDMSAGWLASPSMLSVGKLSSLSLMLLILPPMKCSVNILEKSQNSHGSSLPLLCFDFSGLCQAAGAPHAPTTMLHHIWTNFYKQTTVDTKSWAWGYLLVEGGKKCLVPGHPCHLSHLLSPSLSAAVRWHH